MSLPKNFLSERASAEGIDDVVDEEGNTRLISSAKGPLDAKRSNAMFISIQSYTVALGANISLRDNKGETALDCLRRRYKYLQLTRQFDKDERGSAIIGSHLWVLLCCSRD